MHLCVLLSLLPTLLSSHISLPVAGDEPRRGKALVEPELGLILGCDAHCVLVPGEPGGRGREGDQGQNLFFVIDTRGTNTPPATRRN